MEINSPAAAAILFHFILYHFFLFMTSLGKVNQIHTMGRSVAAARVCTPATSRLQHLFSTPVVHSLSPFIFPQLQLPSSSSCIFPPFVLLPILPYLLPSSISHQHTYTNPPIHLPTYLSQSFSITIYLPNILQTTLPLISLYLFFSAENVRVTNIKSLGLTLTWKSIS